MKKNGFTLIELLAVIIILAILLVIAIPSITMYISDSRKEVYVNTGKELVKGASILVTKNKIDVDDPNTTYYIPYTCMSVEGKDKAKSPYGDFEDAYVVVTIDDDNKYDYYFYSKDTQGFGVYPITEEEALSADCIKSGVESLSTNIGIGRRKNIKVYSSDCSYVETEKQATEKNPRVDSNGNIVEDKNAMFDTGRNVILKMKRLSGEGTSYLSYNNKITSIKLSETEPTDENKQTENIVSTSTSQYPIYMWFEEATGTMYWWSEDDTPSLNESAAYMFAYLKKLKSIDEFDHFDTSNTTDYSYLFIHDEYLKYIDLSSMDTRKATSFNAMFYYCESLEELDVSDWDTSNVTDIGYMFYVCSKLKYLDVSKWNISNVTYASNTFYFCYSLKELDVSKWDTSKITNMEYLFCWCNKLKSIDVSNWNVSKVRTFWATFSNVHAETLDVSKWNTSSATNMEDMFGSNSALVNLDVSGFNTSKVTNMHFMFAQCSILEHLDVSGFDTSKVNDMSYMFFNNYKLLFVDVSHFNTSRVEDMSYMFYHCNVLANLNVSNWNTSNVTDMSNLFNGYDGTTLDVSHWNTSNVTDMSSLFSGCSKVTSLDLSNFNTSKVTDMSYMFCGVDSLESIDLSHLNTSNVTNMAGMFMAIDNIKVIDVSTLDTHKVVNMDYMFYACDNLETILVGTNFVTTYVTSGWVVFGDSPHLKGGAGTTYTYWAGRDFSYARVDGGPSAPGFFTLKNA